MKKLFRISFLLAVLCSAGTAYADGDMTTGTKTCTHNCGGFYEGTTATQTNSSDDTQSVSVGEIYSWIYGQISELID